MFRLVYVSTAAAHFSQADLLELLTKARTKNQHLGVTGMLLYNNGNFMQVLEGEETVVHELFASIERDLRHHSIIVLLEELVLEKDGYSKERVFDNWSMGFCNVGDADLQIVAEFNKFMTCNFSHDSYRYSTLCWDLLNIFRNTLENGSIGALEQLSEF